MHIFKDIANMMGYWWIFSERSEKMVLIVDGTQLVCPEFPVLEPLNPLDRELFVVIEALGKNQREAMSWMEGCDESPYLSP